MLFGFRLVFFRGYRCYVIIVRKRGFRVVLWVVVILVRVFSEEGFFFDFE